MKIEIEFKFFYITLWNSGKYIKYFGRENFYLRGWALSKTNYFILLWLKIPSNDNTGEACFALMILELK